MSGIFMLCIWGRNLPPGQHRCRGPLSVGWSLPGQYLWFSQLFFFYLLILDCYFPDSAEGSRTRGATCRAAAFQAGRCASAFWLHPVGPLCFSSLFFSFYLFHLAAVNTIRSAALSLAHHVYALVHKVCFNNIVDFPLIEQDVSVNFVGRFRK